MYDKTGLEELAGVLHAAGVAIVSTGSTAALVAAAGVPVTAVEELTGFPECLDGRVKTLHPRVHAGILADRDNPDHARQLAELEVEPFDLLVSNLYPFRETVRSGAGLREVVEQIDVGGPSMVRAAAKNHASVAVITDPADYPLVLDAVRRGGFDLATRRRLAARAFACTAAYDTAVARWCAHELAGGGASELTGAVDRSAVAWVDQSAVAWVDQSAVAWADQSAVAWADQSAGWPEHAGLALRRRAVLRYGENPHQRAALYTDPDVPPGLAQAQVRHGKEMSYNNYVDADAAVRAAYDHDVPAVAIIKHANPCGIAVADEPTGERAGADPSQDPIAQAHARAHACDPVSAFGGVVAANRPVTVAMAEQLAEVFTEVVVAPGFEEDAFAVLSGKKNVRLVQLPEGYRQAPPANGHDEDVDPPGGADGADAWSAIEWRRVSGGVLLQTADRIDAPGDAPSSWTLATGEPADAATFADLRFAWRAVRAVRSNAILLARDGASVGVGMGQVNRVDSCRLAVQRAGAERARGAVAASDAFFPFPDGLQVLLDAGVRAVVQPGGSMRDAEVIAAAQAAGATLYLAGVRHFAH
ncbi:MAG: bifunctional phosphoribosylaminoimidazolecarboxamide formyltransferase/IMP cyclohydrolase [Angustibacter sp.]